jgi:hypothetical protein
MPSKKKCSAYKAFFSPLSPDSPEMRKSRRLEQSIIYLSGRWNKCIGNRIWKILNACYTWQSMIYNCQRFLRNETWFFFWPGLLNWWIFFPVRWTSSPIQWRINIDKMSSLFKLIDILRFCKITICCLYKIEFDQSNNTATTDLLDKLPLISRDQLPMKLKTNDIYELFGEKFRCSPNRNLIVHVYQGVRKYFYIFNL